MTEKIKLFLKVLIGSFALVGFAAGIGFLIIVLFFWR